MQRGAAFRGAVPALGRLARAVVVAWKLQTPVADNLLPPNVNHPELTPMSIKFAAFAALTVFTALPAVVHAEDAPSTSYNVGAVTDYRYRGISQTRLKPALQGGIDYSNPNGLYLGTWLSTIKWVKDAGGDASVEWDLYGGYKGALTKEVSYDVGGLYYFYPSNKLGDVAGFANANTFEVYGALTYGMFTAKYSHSLTNTFGFTDSKNSGYLDLSAAIDLGNGFSLTPHLGHQSIAKFNAASYTDYALTVGKDFGNGFSLSAALIGTDASKTGYVTPAGKFTGKTALVLGAKFGF
jgi:uncharacterized protein (TIGR02001 family)